jgi:menaquinol-cytochrome c reductase iron-sulfur subunit
MDPAPEEKARPATDEGRRSLLKKVGAAIAALLGATVAAPVLALLGSPLKRVATDEESLPVGKIERLPEGVPVRADVVAPLRRDAWARYENVPLGAVWLIRHGTEVRALSPTCPHAGCFVDWQAARGAFACPCHGSAFDLAGTCTGGPSPRAMDSLETTVENGNVKVRFQRFRLARANKEPA